MALPHLRYDSYGKPLPTLADARQEGLYDRPFNVQQRRNLLALLEEQWRALLRRGEYADVQISFAVKDGMVQAEVTIGVIHKRRYEREE